MLRPASPGRLRRQHSAAALFSFSFTLFALAGCGKDESTPTNPGNPGAGDALVVQANALLGDILFAEFNSPDPERPSDVDVRPALALYQQSLAVQPTHREANFGVAILNLIALTSDAEVNAAFDEWAAYLATRTPFEARASRRRPLGVPLFFEGGTGSLKLPLELLPLSVVAQHRGLGVPDPQLSRIQAILRDRVIPRLAEARSRLATAAVPGFVFWVTPRMQGDLGADSVEIDQTDLLALKAACGVLQAGCHGAVAYQLGMAAYDSLSLHESVQQNSNWLALVTGGASYVSSTDELLVGAADDADAAITALLAETDPQDNDVIRLGPGGASEVQEIQDGLDDFRAGLGPQGFTQIDDWDNDPNTPPVALTIALGAWFNNPVANLKSLLPAYSGTVVRRPRDTSWQFEQVSTTVDASVPSAGYYDAYVWRSTQNHQTVNSGTSGHPDLVAALQQEIDDRVAELEQIPGYTGNLFSSLSAGGNAPAGGVQSFPVSGYDYFQMATGYVFVPVVHWNAPSFDQWTWPDPTFHGVLPGMGSTQELFQTFGITSDGWTQDLVLDWTGGTHIPASRAGGPRTVRLRASGAEERLPRDAISGRRSR